MPESAGLIFVTSLLVAFSGALIPGPMLAVDISESARHGFRAGPLLIVGHAAVELVLVAALLLGLSSIVSLPWLTASVSLAGGMFLFWTAYNVVTDGKKRDVIPSGIGASAYHEHRTVVSGVLLSVLNPTWLVWWATIGVTFLLWSMQYGKSGPVYFFSGHIMADFMWYSLVAFLVVKGKKFSPSLYRWLMLGSGIFLVLLGAYFIVNGAGYWLAFAATTSP